MSLPRLPLGFGDQQTVLWQRQGHDHFDSTLVLTKPLNPLKTLNHLSVDHQLSGMKSQVLIMIKSFIKREAISEEI